LQRKKKLDLKELDLYSDKQILKYSKVYLKSIIKAHTILHNHIWQINILSCYF